MPDTAIAYQRSHWREILIRRAVRRSTTVGLRNHAVWTRWISTCSAMMFALHQRPKPIPDSSLLPCSLHVMHTLRSYLCPTPLAPQPAFFRRSHCALESEMADSSSLVLGFRPLRFVQHFRAPTTQVRARSGSTPTLPSPSATSSTSPRSTCASSSSVTGSVSLPPPSRVTRSSSSTSRTTRRRLRTKCFPVPLESL